MKIYGKNKQLILDVEVDDSSYRHHVVMGEHNLMLRYSLAEHVEIPVGAYCVFQGETYTLERPESFKMRHRRAFEYSVLMEAAQYKAKVWKFVNPIDGRIKFSLTARPREHLQMLIDNLNEREPERWSIGKCLDDVERVITYDNAYCWDAISQMAEEFGTEFEFRGREVSLRKVEYNTNNPLPLSYGKGNGIKPGTSRSNPTEQTISKLYVQGGERNIDSSKYGASQLHLPKGGKIAFDGDKFEGDEGFVKARSRTYVADNKGYSIMRSDAPQTLGAEDSFDCSYIYPSRAGSVSEVVVANKDKHFYDIIDNTIPVLLNYASCVIAGETLSIVFQSGMLAGKEFEVKYINAAGGGKKGQRFEIVPQEIDGQTMPNETFAPRVGDKYAVFHCMLPSSYIRDDRNKLGAEWNMMRQAVRYLYNRENEGYVYSLSVDEIWAKRNWTQLQVRIILGGMILFSDESFQVQGVRLRITGIKDYINAPNKIEIELSDNLVRGSLSRKIQRIDDSKWSKVDDGYRRSFLDLIRDIQGSHATLMTLMGVLRLPVPDSARLELTEGLIQRYKETLNSDIKGSEAYLNLDRQVDLKEDKSNAKTKYEQLDSEIHKRVPKELFDKKIAEYVPNSKFDNLKRIVNNEISAWTIDRIPTIIDRDIPASTIESYNAEPYNSWGVVGTNRNLDSHVGDTWLVNKAGAEENGKMYRFIKGSKAGTYRWAQMSDSPARVALAEAQRLESVLNDTKEEFLYRLPNKVTEEFNKRKEELKGDGVRSNLFSLKRNEDTIKKKAKQGELIGDYGSSVILRSSGGWQYYPLAIDKIQGGVDVTISFEHRIPDSMLDNATDVVRLGFEGAGGTVEQGNIYVGKTTTREWVRRSIKSSATSDCSSINIVFFGEIRHIKLEIGNTATSYIPHIDDLRGIPGISPSPIDVAREIDTSSFREYLSKDIRSNQEFIKATTGEKGDPGDDGKSVTPVRRNWFDFGCIIPSQREIGMMFDEITAGRILTSLSFFVREGRDASRVCTGVAIQLDIRIKRTEKQQKGTVLGFSRALTVRAIRVEQDNTSILASRTLKYPEIPGLYHHEIIIPLSNDIVQGGFVVHGWLADHGQGLMDCEISNVKVEYLYEGEIQECSSYTPSPSDMIPLLPKIENGEWMLPDQLTRKYLSTGVKAKGEDGAPGEPGKSVTPQEVASVINTDSFRGSISDLIKTDATFVTATTGKQGAPGKDAAPIRPNLLKGYIDRVVTLEAKNNGASSDNFNYDWLVDSKWLEDGKAYVVSADFEWTDGEKPDGVSLLMYKRDNNHLYSHLSLDGRTKARVSIYIPAGVHNTVGIAGYAGRAGKTRGVAAKYSNIKLEEVQEGEPKEASAYLPHTDDLKVPLSSVVKDLKEQGISNEVKELLKADNKFVKATKGEKGDDGKTPKVALGEDRHLYVDGVRQMYSLKGDPGKSVSVSDLHIGWDGTSLVVDGQKSPSLKGEPGVSPSALAVANEMNTASFREGLANAVVSDAKFVAATKGEKGEPGKDATNVRPNLWLSDVKIYPNMGYGADNVHVTYKGDGVYRVTKHDKMYVVVSMYSDKLQEEKTTKTIITSWRVAGASRQELLEEKYLKNKNGRYYIAKNTEHKEVNVRGTLYAHPWLGYENHWIDGDWIEFADVKVELVEDGDILEPTAYIPHVPSLDYLAASTAQKVTQESVYLSRIQNGMARYDDLNQVRKIVEGHQVNWETFDDNYLLPIRQQQDDLRAKQNNSEQRLGDVEKDIIKFAYVEVSTYSSEWRDYTNDEYVGGGGTPDPWGGGGYDGYIRSVHNYELYRSMQNIPPKYIEQSKKVLKTNEYKIGDKFHRDASATIVYDVQEIQGIDKGSARCWEIFTSPHVDSLLRYGKNTRMANPNMQGQQQGSGANAYWNVYLEKNTNYRIFINNDVGNKYSIYVVKNGAY